MLGTSAQRNGETSVELRGVGDETVDVGLPGGRALSAVTEAAVLRDDAEMPTARRQAIDELGPAATARAIAVAGNFEMMNRLLDAIGVGPNEHMAATGEKIGVPLPARFT